MHPFVRSESTPLFRPRVSATTLVIPASLALAALLAGCGAGDGGVCQLDRDCASPLVCCGETASLRGVCRPLGAACVEAPDSGPVDSGSPVDVGPIDAPALDVGPIDDGGPAQDAPAPLDAPEALDAGADAPMSVDAGDDAGEADGGASSDAGASDAP